MKKKKTEERKMKNENGASNSQLSKMIYRIQVDSNGKPTNKCLDGCKFITGINNRNGIISSIKIGSNACQNCDFNKGFSVKDKWVQCEKYANEKGTGGKMKKEKKLKVGNEISFDEIREGMLVEVTNPANEAPTKVGIVSSIKNSGSFHIYQNEHQGNYTNGGLTITGQKYGWAYLNKPEIKIIYKGERLSIEEKFTKDWIVKHQCTGCDSILMLKPASKTNMLSSASDIPAKRYFFAKGQCSCGSAETCYVSQEEIDRVKAMSGSEVSINFSTPAQKVATFIQAGFSKKQIKKLCSELNGFQIGSYSRRFNANPDTCGYKPFALTPEQVAEYKNTLKNGGVIPVAPEPVKIPKLINGRFAFTEQDEITKILNRIKIDLPVLIMGDAGTGKTSLILELARKHKKKISRWCLNGAVDTDEMFGHYVLIDGKTVWQDGVIASAVRKGDWLLLDEVNGAEADILLALHGLMDDSKELVLPSKNEVIKAPDGFRLFATCNIGYAGTKDYNLAFLSRFGVVFELKTPAADEEKEYLMALGTKEDNAEKITQVMSELRRSGIDAPFGLRESCNWAALLNGGLKISEAFKIAVSNKAIGADTEHYEKLLW